MTSERYNSCSAVIPNISSTCWSAKLSNAKPVASLSDDGPNKGKTKYGPAPTPQKPNVWPKSSFCSTKPKGVATSNNPTMPIVEFTKNRPKVSPATENLNCKTELIKVDISAKLLKKLLSPVSTTSGVIAL